MILTKENALNFAQSIRELSYDLVVIIEEEKWESAGEILRDIGSDTDRLMAYVDKRMKGWD